MKRCIWFLDIYCVKYGDESDHKMIVKCTLMIRNTPWGHVELILSIEMAIKCPKWLGNAWEMAIKQKATEIWNWFFKIRKIYQSSSCNQLQCKSSCNSIDTASIQGKSLSDMADHGETSRLVCKCPLSQNVQNSFFIGSE